MPVGRPTKYCDEIVEKSQHYLDNYKSIYGDMIPSIEGLVLTIGINRDTAQDWKGQKGKEAFSAILENISATQKQVLINKGLSGDYNSNIVKLVLGKHGLSEKNQTELTGEGGKDLLPSTITIKHE